jgi:hypothetical protein
MEQIIAGKIILFPHRIHLHCRFAIDLKDAGKAMTARGANVELLPLAALDHDAAIQPYVTGSVQLFKAHP